MNVFYKIKRKHKNFSRIKINFKHNKLTITLNVQKNKYHLDKIKINWNCYQLYLIHNILLKSKYGKSYKIIAYNSFIIENKKY